ncbi:histone-lysine N-methyltransferase eggless isoform X2 [Drosophila kikkawai]|uniref:Histone-lysine N-methyltransferase eggless n=1 Tax=Drosophila kikkawai TaxID=30033 RepID=A0A6P4I0R6_DROKI|nr:histone-lysine N-methyltransferase eggless isoform X2 [Drosophila kikkawai]
MATETAAMDCAEDTETTSKEVPAPPAAEEQEAGSLELPAEEKSAESPVPVEKEEADIEMEDLTLDDTDPSNKDLPSEESREVQSEEPKNLPSEELKEMPTEEPEKDTTEESEKDTTEEPMKDSTVEPQKVSNEEPKKVSTEEPKEVCNKSEEPKEEEKEVINIDLASSPVPAPLDEAAPKPDPAEDTDSSVELIDSPVKSASSNEVAEEQVQPDGVDGAPAVEARPDSEEPVETDSKEADEQADSSIELISSPTPDASPAKKEGEGAKESNKQEQETASEEGIMEVDQEDALKTPADKSKEKENSSEEPTKDGNDSLEKEKPELTADKLDTPMETEEAPVIADGNEVALEVELEKATEQKAPENDEPLPADGDIFYGKDCINYNCERLHKQFVLANMAFLNFYNVTQKGYRQQFVCMECYDAAMDVYEEFAGQLMAKQPLLLKDFRQDHADFVALDSSDEEEEEKRPEKTEFSKNDLNLIESELEDAIKSVLSKVEFQNQLAWSKTILKAKADRLESQFALVDAELESVQSTADQMHTALYSSCAVVHKHMPALDIQHSMSDYMQVPPAGEIVRPPIELNETYYAVKNKAIASWVSIKVIEFTESTAINGNTMKSYKIKYLNTPYQMIKTVTAKHIAYFEPPPVRLTIGTRVIAYFDGTTLSRGKDSGTVQSAFYPGIIAEPLKQANKLRYLIFYDDGYTQYVPHRDVRLVCQASEKVWEDVHPASRDFIQKYVEKYSVDRPMVQCTRGQSMNTESNGTWLYARVIDIDCSLVLMQFEGDKNHTEWIYRGSLRLGPVFKETQNAMNSSHAQQMRVPRRTEPFIRYTKEMESSSQQVNRQMRAIARKSSASIQSVSSPSASSSMTSSPAVSAAAGSRTGVANTVKHLNNSTIYVDDENRPKGHVVYFTAKRNLPPKIYKHHKCNPNCLFKIVHRLDSYSPLAKPLLSGWERLVLRQKTKKNVVYRGPCGKSLRNLAEVHMYLRTTENVLNVDNFDFTPDLRCLAEYSIDPSIVKEADISKGQEKMAIPLVNYYDNTLPPPCTYAKQRIPTEGVHLNLDEEFLVGCDCDDDCSDKSKCACWQLTVAGVRYCNPKKPIEEIGYQYKRLHEHVSTGIYECNSRCKCRKNCLNRVVQFSLEMKLQVFKTSNRGWGLRCVNDIPKGAFICIYAGHLLSETVANQGGQDDEYYADLDYIEVAEQLKEGYESEVEPPSEPEPDDETYGPDPEDNDDDFRPNYHYQRKNKRASRNSSEQDSQERAVINFNPNADLDETVRENSVRRLFGKDEAPYIMDAKTTGNLGRYFNHSCNPNLFVQNVFVDTHDLRFPWVAFFSASHIRSGTELTWNYNYEVGVVPGKVLYCQCGAPNCRIRLL